MAAKDSEKLLTYSGLERPRVCTGLCKFLDRCLIPTSVWASPFYADRTQLIGHTLDPAKLAAKAPPNLGTFETHLSLLEPALKVAASG
ncbi:hypothetical protein PMIN04_009934 [Paraphaeosphaeria minitans]|uniref:Uncharacterized protein n=1 Tax=Paraphaeosphaeria minitans TaxID=565426 RepID=A0A9P6KXA9_9PLEO|nr:hypothetical protein PMIN01_01525 [Paraphaeosphaeria minitans]